MKIATILSAFVMLLAWGQRCAFGDALTEQDVVAMFESGVSGGKIQWLEAQGKKFLTIYTEVEQRSIAGTAIILHGAAGHPDQAQVVHALRTQLPKHRWATLSIQLPLLETDITPQDYALSLADAKTRIAAAIDYLQKANVRNIALIGYGLGAAMAVAFLSDNSVTGLSLVTVSLDAAPQDGGETQVIDQIKALKMPFLDIYAGLDVPGVLSSTAARRLAAKQNVNYRQVEIIGDNHNFYREQALLVKRVYSWLTSLKAG